MANGRSHTARKWCIPVKRFHWVQGHTGFDADESLTKIRSVYNRSVFPDRRHTVEICGVAYTICRKPNNMSSYSIQDGNRKNIYIIKNNQQNLQKCVHNSCNKSLFLHYIFCLPTYFLYFSASNFCVLVKKIINLLFVFLRFRVYIEFFPIEITHGTNGVVMVLLLGGDQGS